MEVRDDVSLIVPNESAACALRDLLNVEGEEVALKGDARDEHDGRRSASEDFDVANFGCGEVLGNRRKDDLLRRRLRGFVLGSGDDDGTGSTDDEAGGEGADEDEDEEGDRFVSRVHDEEGSSDVGDR